jgi:hypothetical protein
MTSGRNRKQAIALTVTVATLVVAVTVAWLLDFNAQAGDTVYRVALVRDEEVVRTFELEELRALPARQIKMQGEVQEGPPLLDVLRAAGVTEFTSLTVTGLGLRDSGRLVLRAADVDEDVLLDFSLRGTVKVAGPEIAWEDRVRDVERIEVR